MQGGSPRILVVAAMEHEIKRWTVDWERTRVEAGSREIQVYVDMLDEEFGRGHTAVTVSGIGARAAANAAESLMEAFDDASPRQLLSIGFAGALDATLKVGEVIRPAAVLDAATGQRFDIAAKGPLLATAAGISNKQEKLNLLHSCGAAAVDMEAAAVARVAQMHGVKFAAVKVISDELDFPMPPLQRFVTATGQFKTWQFGIWAALRPRVWPVIARMKKDADVAAESLAQAVRDYLQELRNS